MPAAWEWAAPEEVAWEWAPPEASAGERAAPSGGDMGVGALGGVCMVAGAHWRNSMVAGPVGVAWPRRPTECPGSAGAMATFAWAPSDNSSTSRRIHAGCPSTWFDARPS